VASARELILRDPEILSIVATARKEIRGEGDGYGQEDEFEILEDNWIWEGIIAARVINLVVALQKVGKTALMLALVRVWSNNFSDFLTCKLHGSCPPVIIVGTDMTLQDWGKMLLAAGLAEKTTGGKARILKPIVRLWDAKQGIHLDDSGIEKIASLCAENIGALLIMDSFASLISPLGLDEFKPEAAEPLYALMEAIEPFQITPIIIHHSSKSRSSERAPNAARGSNAITAAVSQLVNLKWISEEEEDHRIELHTQGRGALPLHLVIEQVERCSWIYHGETAEIRRQESLVKVQENLNERQRRVLAEVESL